MKKLPCNYYEQCGDCIDCLLGFDSPISSAYEQASRIMFNKMLLTIQNRLLEDLYKDEQ